MSGKGCGFRYPVVVSSCAFGYATLLDINCVKELISNILKMQ